MENRDGKIGTTETRFYFLSRHNDFTGHVSYGLAGYFDPLAFVPADQETPSFYYFRVIVGCRFFNISRLRVFPSLLKQIV